MSESFTKIASKEYVDKRVEIFQGRGEVGKAMIVNENGDIEPRSLLNTHTHTINEITDLSLSDGKVDMSDFYTKEEIDAKINEAMNEVIRKWPSSTNYQEEN